MNRTHRMSLVASLTVGVLLALGCLGEEGDTCETMFDCAENLDCINGSCAPFNSGDTAGGGGSTDGCSTFTDSYEYFTDNQLNSYCWAAGLYQACGETENYNYSCDTLAGMIDLGYDGGGDCPYCSGG